MAFSGYRTSWVILKYAGEAGDARLVKIESGPESAEIVHVKSSTGFDSFFRGPFELY